VNFYEKCGIFIPLQIEKTEINILQKEWEKAFLLFKVKIKTIFESY